MPHGFDDPVGVYIEISRNFYAVTFHYEVNLIVKPTNSCSFGICGFHTTGSEL